MASVPPSSEGASQSSANPSSNPGAPAVIIACAVADAPIVGEVSRSLSERGHEVEVVPGAEGESSLLTQAVEKFQRQGLYVLCRSGAMERIAVDNLRAILRREGVPFGRTLTLAIESGSQAARTLEDRILSVARRMVTGRGESSPVASPAILPPPTTKVTKAPEPPSEDMGEEIDTKVSQSGSAPAPKPQPPGYPAPPTKQLEESDVDAWADSLAGKPIPDEFGKEPDTSVDQAYDGEAIGAGAPAPAEDQPSEALAAIDSTQVERLSDLAPLGDDFAPSGVDRTQVNRHDVEKLMASKAEPEAAQPGSAPISTAPPVGLAGASAAPSSAPSTSSMEVAAFRAGPSRATLLMVSGALCAVAVLIAVVMLFRDDDKPETDEASKDKVAAVDDAKKEAAEDASAKAPEKDSADDEAAARTGGEEPAADAEGDEPPADEGGEEPADEGGEEPADEGGEEPADEGGDDADESPAEPAGDLPETPPTPPEGPPAVEDADVVLAALESRNVRALDIFLVSADPTKSLPFASAETYCNTLELEGLSSWRLPTIGELNSLNEARLFKSGLFWSSTMGDAFGDERLVFNIKKNSIGSVAARWDGAQAVCVRERS
jgi:hypothetical protein